MLRRMKDLEDMGTIQLRDKQVVNWILPGGCMIRLGGAQRALNTPLNFPDKTVVWQNVPGFRILQIAKDRVEIGEGARFAIHQPQMINQINCLLNELQLNSHFYAMA